ncbi:MAG: polysaccharide deacetylase [Betaproteobacteria bacterium]|nr:polysaccharide deacetylase [Betaproteobacteria bacterium]
MLPRERLPFSPIEGRRPLAFPKEGRLIVWPVLALEDWDISRPMARTVIPPPQGQVMLPDVPNWSWHEYGMRVAFWRLRRMYERLGIRPTVTLNAKVCQSYPQVVEACMQSGWELNAHSYEQIPMHKLENQRAVIEQTVDIITKFSGQRPRGWFGPGLTQTYDTLDYLADAGIEYIGDWSFDDEPVRLRTTSQPVVALPYNFELHDIVMMAIQHNTADAFYTRTMDYFECLYEESAQRPKVMAVACHPYLSGSPHRIVYVEKAFAALASRPGVVFWDGAQILDWFNKQER